ncbi:hypothetical protein Goari_023025 [Gossypium aridum]|uniref:BZIP domain-containing protein n=1 Tax=Gossypium aridum TaxID=34290 RepID=A0A7J8YT67_GOSAI|nr:hypothetical protein [Gossypium aridum]
MDDWVRCGVFGLPFVSRYSVAIVSNLTAITVFTLTVSLLLILVPDDIRFSMRSVLMPRIRALHSFSVVFLYWPASSGSESDPRYANINERKRKRMLSNRESARRSRMKKRKLMEDLGNEVSLLQKENSRLSKEINASTQRYIEMESANNLLKAEAMGLTERLRSLNSVLHIVEEVNGYAVEIPEIPDDPC